MHARLKVLEGETEALESWVYNNVRDEQLRLINENIYLARYKWPSSSDERDFTRPSKQGQESKPKIT
jgi:hypothetical protein